MNPNSQLLNELKLPTIVIITTGGTIAMRTSHGEGKFISALSGAELISAIPELSKIANIKVIEFCNIPSPYMNQEIWLSLSNKINEILEDHTVLGVIVTHGTDTMVETAYFLDLTLCSNKPVVFVGAQRNASEEDTDGKRNIYNAVMQILSKDAIGMGVTITMNHYINSARNARKSHTHNVQTFLSGDYGYLGYIYSDKVIFFQKPLRRQTIPRTSKLPKVDIIQSYPGADSNLLKYSVESGSEGIIIEGTGFGNVNNSMYDGIQYALEKNIPVVITSKVEGGRVLPVYDFNGGGKSLEKLGVIFGNDLDAGKARILLMLTMPIAKDRIKLQNYFNT